MLSLIAIRHLLLQVIEIIVYTARDAFLTHDGCHLHDFHPLPIDPELMGLSVICTGKHQVSSSSSSSSYDQAGCYDLNYRLAMQVSSCRNRAACIK